MFKQLKTIIKEDPESQEQFEEIEAQYYVDMEHRGNVSTAKRAKSVSILMVIMTIVSLLFLLYAFQVKSKSAEAIDQLTYEVEQLESRLTDCN